VSHRRFASVRENALAQGGVMTRRQLYGTGLTRWMVEAEVRAGRWHPLGSQTLFVLDAAVCPDPELAVDGGRCSKWAATLRSTE